MERVYELLELLADAIIKEFPDMTTADFRVDVDGYRTINVDKTERKEGVPVEIWLRRSLWDQYVYGGTWSKDRSSEQNEYYERNNTLLKEGA